MTFLELANRLLSEANISGSGLITTVNQKGEYKQAVDYINTAYQDIQNLHSTWNFLRKDIVFNTIENVNNYFDTSIGLSDYGDWSLDTMRVYLASAGISNEVHMTPFDWDDFRDAFLFGASRSQVGMPIYICEKPDNSLIVYPTPNDIYTINGEYYREPFTLALDTDKPAFPAKFHMIIVWRALMYFATQLNAQELYAIGNVEYRKLLLKLEQFDLPPHTVSGALA
jgi:hypothetical protein